MQTGFENANYLVRSDIVKWLSYGIATLFDVNWSRLNTPK